MRCGKKIHQMCGVNFGCLCDPLTRMVGDHQFSACHVGAQGLKVGCPLFWVVEDGGAQVILCGEVCHRFFNVAGECICP